jgi:hypothetical protein
MPRLENGNLVIIKQDLPQRRGEEVGGGGTAKPSRPSYLPRIVPTRNLGFVRAGGRLIGSMATNEVLPQRTDQWKKVMPHLHRKDLLDFDLVLD